MQTPILRPAVFWGNVFRPRCAYFVLALTIPLGLANVARGWLFALAAALPLGIQVVGHHGRDGKTLAVANWLEGVLKAKS
ncbi:MAG TPA: hypothetical protein PLG99_04410 [Kaistiaceae bacterium]|nr:hypothetical protein [Kaistiaceae bacterium]